MDSIVVGMRAVVDMKWMLPLKVDIGASTAVVNVCRGVQCRTRPSANESIKQGPTALKFVHTFQVMLLAEMGWV
ncbi:unnamed protein product [Taenia asiatica]|uniref:Secreted protein n=1 Tax=Taenia asiatica TaxID=60517 RepID=A0A0R3WFM2_TAEAS|nr:unnamed protein product [Taenia asiatica]